MDEDVATTSDRLRRLRRSYEKDVLREEDLAPDPFAQFQRWFDDARDVGLIEPNGVVLATSTPEGVPSARTVLLKGLDTGFVLYTHHTSRKGREMLANPRASLVVPWFAMDRQVVVLGTVEQVSREESRTYFESRPHDSQVGAWASEQSEVLPDRAALEARFAEAAARWPEGSRRAVARALGRVPRRARDGRVLAGPTLAAARPAALPACGRRVGAGASRPLTGRLPGTRPTWAVRCVDPKAEGLLASAPVTGARR